MRKETRGRNIGNNPAERMKVIHSIEAMSFNPLTVVTIGSFDGVHLGHREILRHTRESARTIHGRSVVVTFDPHPRDVVGRGPVQKLSTLEERLELIEREIIDETLIIHFNYEFSQLEARDFYERYLVKQIGVHEVVIGHDHLFGRNREGSIEILQQLGKEFNFNVVVIPGVTVNEHVVSSSQIRKALLSGNVEHAALLLGRPYPVSGKVIEGDKRGREIGFPTANIQYDNTKKLTPASGVYVVQVELESQTLYGMLNIGVRPTFQSNGQQYMEVHLLNFEGDIYGKTLHVSFLRRLRSEQKFNSVDDLVAQLQNDRRESQSFVTTLHQ